MACLLFRTSLNLFKVHVKQETKGIFNNNWIQSQRTLFSVSFSLLLSLTTFIIESFTFFLLHLISLSPLFSAPALPALCLHPAARTAVGLFIQVFGLGMGTVFILGILQIPWPLAETCPFWSSVPHHLLVLGLLERLNCPQLHSEM